MVSMQQFVKWGLDREIPELIEPLPGPQLNLGPGDRKLIEGTIGVGPRHNKLTDVEWYAGTRLPFDNDSIAAVHVHQFMEHFDAEKALDILGEIQRVLVRGGVVFMTTPYPGHGHFTQALDHKTMWTEETWQWLFENSYYNAGLQQKWTLRVHACFLAGIVYRNLDLFTQLVKA